MSILSDKPILNKKGQLTIVNLIVILLTLVVFVAILPIFNNIVAIGVNETSGTSAFLLQLIPLILIVLIIMTALLLVQPRPPSAFG